MAAGITFPHHQVDVGGGFVQDKIKKRERFGATR
jgi:hypothetical protein